MKEYQDRAGIDGFYENQVSFNASDTGDQDAVNNGILREGAAVSDTYQADLLDAATTRRREFTEKICIKVKEAGLRQQMKLCLLTCAKFVTGSEKLSK